MKFKSRKEFFDSAKNVVSKVSHFKVKSRSDNYTGTPLRDDVSFGNVVMGRHPVVRNQIVNKNINVLDDERK